MSAGLVTYAVSAATLVPGQIKITSITPSSGQLVIAWSLTAPGGTLTDVEFTTDNGTTWLTTGATTSPVTIATTSRSALVGLQDGNYSHLEDLDNDGAIDDTIVGYAVALRAVNASGEGPSSQRFEVIVGSARTQPASIAAVTSGDRSFTLTLVHPVRGTGVGCVEYSTDSGATWSPLQPYSTSLTVSSLSSDQTLPLVNGTRYGLRVRYWDICGGNIGTAISALPGFGISGASTTVFATPSDVPAPSEILSITSRATSLVVNAELGFTGGSVITRLEYSTDNGSTWAAILPIPAALVGKLDTPGTAYSFTLANRSEGGSLSADTSYSVTLRSVNLIGNSIASAAMVAETTGVGFLAPPSIDTVTVRNSSFIVKAILPTLPTGVSTNRVEYSTDGGTTWRNSGQKTGNFIVSRTSAGAVLSIGTLYSIAVRLVTTAGVGLASETYQISAGNVSAPPVLYTASSNDGLITVSGALGNTNGASVTRLEYSTDNGASWFTGMTLADVTAAPSSPTPTVTTTTVASSSTTVAPTTTTTVAPSSSITGIPKNWTFVVSNVSSSISTPIKPGTVYLMRVRAVSAAGVSGPSNSKAVTLAGSPKAPTIQSATAANNSITLTVSYTRPSGVTVTDIEYSTDDGVSWVSSGDTGNSLVITEESSAGSSFLSPGELYIIRIRIIANGGVSGTSAPRSVRTTGTDAALTIEKLTDKPLSSGSFDVKGKAKSKSNRAIVYTSSTPATCSVLLTKVTLLQGGVCTIVASVVADGEFKKDSVSASFTITEVKSATLAVGEDMKVADLVLLQFPAKAPKATVQAMVVPASKSICTLNKATVVTVKAGICKVKLVSKDKAGKTISKIAKITVT